LKFTKAQPVVTKNHTSGIPRIGQKPQNQPTQDNTQNDQLKRYGFLGESEETNTNQIQHDYANQYQPKSNIDDELLPFSEQENLQLLDNLNKLKLGVEYNSSGGDQRHAQTSQ